MKLVIEKDKEGFSKAHPSTQSYIIRLSRREFSNIEEVETELSKNGPPFQYPKMDDILDTPLIGHVPISEFKPLQKYLDELIKKYNPDPWPRILYVDKKPEIKVVELPLIVKELPIIEYTQDSFVDKKEIVAKIVSKE